MPTTAACPKCQNRLTIPDTVPPGRKVRCSKCQTTFAVPGRVEAALPAEGIKSRPKGEPPDRPPAPEQAGNVFDFSRPQNETAAGDENRPVRKKSKKKKKARGNAVLLWSLLGGGAALVLAAAAVVLIIVLNQDTDDQAAKSGSSGDQRKSANPWEPEPALLKQLTPETTVGPYRLRPPRSYSLMKQGDAQNPFTAWAGPRSSDGTASVLVIAIGPMLLPERDFSLERLLQTFLVGLRTQFADAEIVTTEQGQLGGLDFIRTRVEGTIPKVRKKGLGFIYLAKDGPNMSALFYLDIGYPYHESVALIEASVLTFRKP